MSKQKRKVLSLLACSVGLSLPSVYGFNNYHKAHASEYQSGKINYNNNYQTLIRLINKYRLDSEIAGATNKPKLEYRYATDASNILAVIHGANNGNQIDINVTRFFNNLLNTAKNNPKVYKNDVNMINQYNQSTLSKPNISPKQPAKPSTVISPSIISYGTTSAKPQIALASNVVPLAQEVRNYCLKLAQNYMQQKQYQQACNEYQNAQNIIRGISLAQGGNTKLINQYNDMSHGMINSIENHHVPFKDCYEMIACLYDPELSNDSQLEHDNQKINNYHQLQKYYANKGNYSASVRYKILATYIWYSSHGIPFNVFYAREDNQIKNYNNAKLRAMKNGDVPVAYYDSLRADLVSKQKFGLPTNHISKEIKRIKNSMSENLAINQKAEMFRNQMISNINSARINDYLNPLTISNTSQQVAEKRIGEVAYAYDHYNDYHDFNNSKADNLVDDWVHGHDIHDTTNDEYQKHGTNTTDATGENVAMISESPDSYYQSTPNIHYNTTTPNRAANSIHDWMMNHDQVCGNGHRANILNPSYNNMGIAVRYNNGNYYVDEEFHGSSNNNGAMARYATPSARVQKPKPKIVAKPVKQINRNSNSNLIKLA